jgi:hypothetical protein
MRARPFNVSLILLLLAGCGAAPHDSDKAGSETAICGTSDSAPATLPTETTLTSDELADLNSPIVVRTSPTYLEHVDASSVDAVEVTFSQDMNPATYSWLAVEADAFPDVTR